MAITAESTSTRIILNISDNTTKQYILQRAYYQNKTWLTYTESGFALLSDLEETLDTSDETETKDTETEGSAESLEPKFISAGDFVDSFNLSDGLYEYRYIAKDSDTTKGENWSYSTWVKFGNPAAIGYTFNNYSAPEGEWGTPVTPDDCRYTFLWGTDFKATNGQYFSDEQINYFIMQAVYYLERELNITIKKRVVRAQAKERNLVKGTDYDEEESLYDFSYRKIQRYGMIQTNKRPIIDVQQIAMIERGGSEKDLSDNIVIDRRKGIIKFLKRPFRESATQQGIGTAIGIYGQESMNPHLFYAIDYTAGYENSDDLPADLKEMIGKVAAVSLLNIIGDGLMSGFSSSSLSMDGISESFSSTQSATSAYFGARIQVYKDDIKNYIAENKYKFGYMPIGAL